MRVTMVDRVAQMTTPNVDGRRVGFTVNLTLDPHNWEMSAAT
jgi:hypothetical protein